jgi:predicted dehydrogenase
MSIFVVEPDRQLYLLNLQKIGFSEKEITWFNNIDDIPKDIDFAIIATSAGPRFKLTKDLIKNGVKYFLLEKIVFQSESQFNEIIHLIEKNGCAAYCNFVSRYFPNYIDIKNNLNKTSPIKMVVNGGDFGLGCNALHGPV